jgi:hypothetical protein
MADVRRFAASMRLASGAASADGRKLQTVDAVDPVNDAAADAAAGSRARGGGGDCE